MLTREQVQNKAPEKEPVRFVHKIGASCNFCNVRFVIEVSSVLLPFIGGAWKPICPMCRVAMTESDVH